MKPHYSNTRNPIDFPQSENPMNERIGKLAEQAGLLGPTSRVGNSHQATAKFAELLVTEVISTIALYSLANFDSGSVMREECANLIRLIESDFGVLNYD